MRRPVALGVGYDRAPSYINVNQLAHKIIAHKITSYNKVTNVLGMRAHIERQKVSSASSSNRYARVSANSDRKKETPSSRFRRKVKPSPIPSSCASSIDTRVIIPSPPLRDRVI